MICLTHNKNGLRSFCCACVAFRVVVASWIGLQQLVFIARLENEKAVAGQASRFVFQFQPVRPSVRVRFRVSVCVWQSCH